MDKDKDETKLESDPGLENKVEPTFDPGLGVRDQVQLKLESLKMVKEWCTWLAGLQTGICALLWEPVKKALEALRAADIALLHWGWLAFLLSLLLTVLLLGRLPGLIERLGKDEGQTKRVFDEVLFADKYVKLRTALWVIHLVFCAGAGLIGFFVLNRWIKWI